jgi:hypothetical protein
MQGIPICFRINGHGGNAHLLTGFHYPNGDFASVGYQYFFQRV